MNIDKIVEVNIQISEAMSIDGGYDTILIVGPLPKAPGGRVTPDVAGYRACRTSRAPDSQRTILCTLVPARCLDSPRSRPR